MEICVLCEVEIGALFQSVGHALTRTVADLSPRRPEFNSRPVQTRDVGRVVRGHVIVTRWTNGRSLRIFHKAKRSDENRGASDRKLL